MAGTKETAEPRWLVLFYQVPPKPPYLRVRISRRLSKVGALGVKPTVYVLPLGDGALEDFQWVAREVSKEGGDATICEARFIEGLTEPAVRRMFNDARDAEYRSLAEAAREASTLDESSRDAEVVRLKQRLSDLGDIDFFSAPGKAAAEASVRRLEVRGKGRALPVEKGRLAMSAYRGRFWVTRQGIHVDRIASAWLIREFIDPKARFKFVSGKSYERLAGELRFDMFEGEFTHEGENCSFETLLERFGLHDKALRALAEIIHDIDLKDRKYRREEAPGIDRLIAGICMANPADRHRMSAGSLVFRSLYEYYRRKLS